MKAPLVRSALVLAAVLALAGVSFGRPILDTAAQESSLAGHPLVGTWMAMTPFGASPEIFSADGSMVAGPPVIEPGEAGVTYYGPAVGVWESTGDQSGRFTFVQSLGDPSGAYIGTLTIDGHLAVSDDGMSFVDDSPETTITIRDAANNVLQVIYPYQSGDGSVPPVTGIRMAVGAPGFPAPSEATPAS